ncbi:response regulator [Marinobacter sp. DUT-1]|uniref:response regulator n=1 Tax=Marinobacter sp. DUT-1 TaxID=3412037 RepID=UPI003D17FDA3
MDKPVNPALVVVADDDPDDCLMIREAFEDQCADCTLCFVHDGEELMDFLRGQHPDREGQVCAVPDLLLLDLNMPLKDGRQSLQEIKSDPRLQVLPTVIMTTSSDQDDRDFCQQRGANDYIVKPRKYSDLLDVVESLTKQWINREHD